MSDKNNLDMAGIEASYIFQSVDHSEARSSSRHRNLLSAGPIKNRHYLENNYTFNNKPSNNVITSTHTYVKKYYRPSRECMGGYFYKRFPFFKWIQNYKLKENIVKDIVAGVTLGVVQIPQGMAYSLMAGLPPINGLYVTFILVLQYVLFGTSKHISAGIYYSNIPDVDSAVNLTVHSSVLMQPTVSVNNFIHEDAQEAKIIIAEMLALMSGFFLILFSVFHLGAFTKYLSDSIVNGFTTGAAYHVVVSQIGPLLGLKLSGVHWSFVIPGDIYDVFKSIKTINWATFIVSIIFIPMIYIIKFLNNKYKKKLPVPIPVELLSVILGTSISYAINLGTKYNVKIIGELKTGFPAPRVPSPEIFTRLFKDLALDSLEIAILTFALNISIAKSYARLHKYDIKANQELLTYGIGNVICFFFGGFPGCIGLSRTVINDEIGVKTQVSGFFTSSLLLIVILWIGPLFKHLPNAVLASIIVVSLWTKLVHVVDFFPLLRTSKIEAMGWAVTFLGVMILNSDIGLYIGIASSIIMIILKSQRARVSVMGNIPNTSIFECIQTCNEAREFPGIKIIRYEESIYYANVDNFKYHILKLSHTNPAELMHQIDKAYAIEVKKLMKAYAIQKKLIKLKETVQKVDYSEYILDDDGLILLDENMKNLMNECRNKVLSKNLTKHVILDCSCMNYIDSQAVNCILDLYESFKMSGVEIYMSHCKQQIIKAFRKNKSFTEKIEFDRFLTSTNEAIRYIITKDRSLTVSVLSDDINHFGKYDNKHFGDSVSQDEAIEMEEDMEEDISKTKF